MKINKVGQSSAYQQMGHFDREHINTQEELQIRKVDRLKSI